MDDISINELEIASASVVSQAVRDLAAALAETSQFIDFETAAERLHKDPEALQAIEAFQARQQSLQMMVRLNAVSPEELAELERLRQAYLSMPSVKAYLGAQEKLGLICSAVAGLISKSTGLDYATACGKKCCG